LRVFAAITAFCDVRFEQLGGLAALVGQRHCAGGCCCAGQRARAPRRGRLAGYPY
jgi:hypothetical protein